MEPKTYSRNALEAICDDDIEGTLPWFTLVEPGGLFLIQRRPSPGRTKAEREVLGWNARADRSRPALPIPFTAYDLAAFTLAGMGTYILERFESPEDEDALDEYELDKLGGNDGAQEVLCEANRLRLMARGRFGSDDDGVTKAAHWLLNDAHRELTGDPPPAEAASTAGLSSESARSGPAPTQEAFAVERSRAARAAANALHAPTRDAKALVLKWWDEHGSGMTKDQGATAIEAARLVGESWGTVRRWLRGA